MRTRTNCALVASPAVRRHANANTDAIAPNFPAGISRPALRALVSAGLTELRHLSRIRESDLAEMHGMGPKAIGQLRAAMRSAGMRFKR
jgi:hypothetical protein